MVLEESKSLVLVGIGCRGIAPLHAALTWTPVQVRCAVYGGVGVGSARGSPRACWEISQPGKLIPHLCHV